VPCAPLNGYEEALADVQARHLQLVQPQSLPGGTLTRTVGCPVRLDGQVVAVDTRPPALDEHGPALRARPLAEPTPSA
jgi:crotonobetainyl-CoA:carnitine CoA-transferase CaiB-like acyl-CoA transferase